MVFSETQYTCVAYTIIFWQFCLH